MVTKVENQCMKCSFPLQIGILQSHYLESFPRKIYINFVFFKKKFYQRFFFNFFYIFCFARSCLLPCTIAIEIVVWFHLSSVCVCVCVCWWVKWLEYEELWMRKLQFKGVYIWCVQEADINLGSLTDKLLFFFSPLKNITNESRGCRIKLNKFGGNYIRVSVSCENSGFSQLWNSVPVPALSSHTVVCLPLSMTKNEEC